MAGKIAAVISGTIGRDREQVAEAFAMAVGERHVAAVAKAMCDAREDEDEVDGEEPRPF